VTTITKGRKPSVKTNPTGISGLQVQNNSITRGGRRIDGIKNFEANRKASEFGVRPANNSERDTRTVRVRERCDEILDYQRAARVPQFLCPLVVTPAFSFTTRSDDMMQGPDPGGRPVKPQWVVG
jgi:hypothetical protein